MHPSRFASGQLAKGISPCSGIACHCACSHCSLGDAVHVRCLTGMAKKSSGIRKFWTSFTASALSAYAMASGALHLQLPELGWQQVGAYVGGKLSAHLPFSQPGFSQCAGFFPQRMPPQLASTNALRRELCFSQFALLHDGRTRTPVFVVERLNRASVLKARSQTRTSRFYAEARLPQAERAMLDDYQGSGWARGHMAPAADMATAEAMAQSFSLANMVPQNHAQNAGPWAKIEQDTRQYALRAKGDVFVFTGPVFDVRPKKVGGRVGIPSHVFKLVHDATTGRSWVHWQANRADAKAGAPISYEEFVRRTGLSLLPEARAESARMAQMH